MCFVETRSDAWDVRLGDGEAGGGEEERVKREETV